MTRLLLCCLMLACPLAAGAQGAHPSVPRITIAMDSVAPVWRYFGDGSEGAYSCPSGTCPLYGEHWYSSVNIAAGATVVQTSSAAGMLVIRSTGTCTIAGTVSVSANTGGAAGSTVTGLAGGGGGGGGGGAAGGTAGSAMSFGAVGAAGASSGGAGGNGTQLVAQYVKVFLANGHAGMNSGATSQLGGSKGGAGGSTGGAGGAGGGYVAIVCRAIDFTGTIDASGANGGNSTGNSVGSGGGGGGGLVVLSALSYPHNTGTINVAGGSGGSCGAFTTCGAGGNGATGNSAVLTIR